MTWVGVCACFFSFSVAIAQVETGKAKFEVASIKPSDLNASSPMWVGMTADPGMVRYTNITLRDCIRAAYRVRDFQIQAPPWMSGARFEITAKLASGASLDQIPEMLQALLAERFKLTLRRDSREQSVYALIVGKGGANMKPAQVIPDARTPTAVGPDGKPRPPLMFKFVSTGVHPAVQLTAPTATLASFVEVMSRFTERPVVDLTGIAGQFDLNLTFASETTRSIPMGGPPVPATGESSEPAPSVFEAVQKYGLKLERRKAPMELLTVTHIEKTPTEN
jgi:uncharacterized protein (TIGR03435 family)